MQNLRELFYKANIILLEQSSSALFELFPRDGLIALLAALLALLVPVAILVIERSKAADEHRFPWEEEATIMQVAHPKVLFASIICASLSCIFWNNTSKQLLILPIVLVIYIVCIVAICWVMYELYRWLLSIISTKRNDADFRTKQITTFFNNIEEDDERVRIWSMTWSNIWENCPEQHLLIMLYLNDLKRHKDNGMSYLALCHSFTANISRIDLRELKALLAYSLEVSVMNDSNVMRRYAISDIFTTILRTIKHDNIFLMGFAYDSIAESTNEKQSYAMTRYFARNFFSILNDEKVSIQEKITDTCRFPHEWRFQILIEPTSKSTSAYEKRLKNQSYIWLAQYTDWLCVQYVKRYNAENEERFYTTRIIEKVTLDLFFGCDIDWRMFGDVILLLFPIGGAPQSNESDEHAYIRIFLEKGAHRDFLCFNEDKVNDERYKNTARLLSLMVRDSSRYPDCYLDEIENYKKELEGSRSDYGKSRDYQALLSLQCSLKFIKKYKNSEQESYGKI